MRKFSLYVLFFVSLLFVASMPTDESPLASLYDKYKRNKRLITKLEAFEKEGCQYLLDTKNLSADRLIREAKNYLGIPHCMGGNTTKCLDCSGLLVLVFGAYKVNLPHNSEAQARYGEIVPDYERLQPGDLVFFIDTYKTRQLITHSGIYMGDNMFIHTSSKKGVMVSGIKDNPYWEERFIFATRVLSDK